MDPILKGIDIELVAALKELQVGDLAAARASIEALREYIKDLSWEPFVDELDSQRR